VDLALDQHRVDGRAAVVDGDPAHDRDLPRLGVDVDHAGVRAERPHEVVGVVEGRLVEAGLVVLGQVGRDVGLGRDVGEAQRLVRRALDAELPSATSMSSGAASSLWATIRLALSWTFWAARETASPPTASEREP
jgi:hypothetical protein